MSCPLSLNGISLGCKDNIGGIKEVYINDRSNISATPTLTSNVITAIPHGVAFSKYYFKKQTGQMTTTGAFNDANGTNVYTTDVALKFNKLETIKHQEFLSLAKGSLVAIILDNNGKYWYLGFDNEVIVTANVGMTGTNFVDANGYDLTIQDIAKQYPYEVSSSIISSLLS